jgi:Flp pilus assembly pilin Flp
MHEHKSKVAEFFKQFLLDDTGQDLIEYALLTGLISVGSVVLFQQIAASMNSAYAGPSGWNKAAQAVWEPCAPGGCT